MAGSRIEQGDELLRIGYPEAAVACFRRALEADPGNAEAHLGLGGCHEVSGRWGEAAAEYRAAIRCRSGWAAAHCRLCYVLTMLGSPEEALEHGEQAMRLEPDYPLAVNNVGNCMLMLGRAEEAIACYRRAIELAPSMWFQRLGLAATLSGRGQFEDALSLLDGLDEEAWMHGVLLEAILLTAVGREAEGGEALSHAMTVMADPPGPSMAMSIDDTWPTPEARARLEGAAQRLLDGIGGGVLAGSSEGDGGSADA